MQRKILLIIIILVMILQLGCEDCISQKFLQQSKALIESENYEKAIISLQVALDKDKDNEEASILYEIVNDYKSAQKYINDKKFEEAVNILNSINEDYVNYHIKDDIEELKDTVKVLMSR